MYKFILIKKNLEIFSAIYLFMCANKPREITDRLKREVGRGDRVDITRDNNGTRFILQVFTKKVQTREFMTP